MCRGCCAVRSRACATSSATDPAGFGTPSTGQPTAVAPAPAILDIDGTLVDSDYQHAVAWFRALRDAEELRRELGKTPLSLGKTPLSI
jgi:hypothetical protein